MLCAVTHRMPDPAPGALTLTISARVAGGAAAVAGADVELAVVPAAHATRVPGDLWTGAKETLSGPPPGRPGWGFPGCRGPGLPGQPAALLCITRSGRLVGALTTEPPCVVPGFKAARDAGRAERTPGALLVWGDGLPVDLPVPSEKASSGGLQGPGLGRGRDRPCCLPARPCQFLPALPGSQGAG